MHFWIQFSQKLKNDKLENGENDFGVHWRSILFFSLVQCLVGFEILQLIGVRYFARLRK